MEQISASQKLSLILSHALEYHSGLRYFFTEHGFISYKVEEESVIYMVDIYIVPEKRRKGYAFDMANSFASQCKKEGIMTLLGTVQKDYFGKEGSIAALKYWGMEKYAEDDNTIYYVKEI